MKPTAALAPEPGMPAPDPVHAPTTRAQDAVQQRQMQSRLDLLLSGIDHINDSVLMIRAPTPTLRSARVVLANAAFERQTGLAREQIVGRRLPALKGIVGAQLFSHMRHHVTSVRDGTTHRLEFLVPRRDGSSFWIELDISSLADAHEPGTRYWIAVGRDITERKDAERQIHHLAFFDSLTQLPNRQLLLDRLRMALASADRSGRRGALIFMGLDNFKVLNDTRGHTLGDLLLQQVAHRFSARLREGGTVARLGGDEFVVLLPDVAEDAQEAARRVHQVASDLLAELARPFDLDGYQYHGAASLGITGWGSGNHNAGEVLKQADMAMYRAKGAGGNRIAFFDPEAQLALNHRAALTHELRAALRSGEQFVLHYQPQFNSTRQVIGAEALLRCNTPRAACSAPKPSSCWPRPAASSCRWANGCWSAPAPSSRRGRNPRARRHSTSRSTSARASVATPASCSRCWTPWLATRYRPGACTWNSRRACSSATARPRCSACASCRSTTYRCPWTILAPATPRSPTSSTCRWRSSR